MVTNSQVTESAVRQYEGNFSLLFTQLTDQIADAQVPESAVTQHEAALAIAFSQLTGLPSTLAGHGITDAYTEAEVDTLLAGKSDVGHIHDSRYYTETEVDLLIADFLTQTDTDALYSPLGHTHDSRYYTETEIDGFFAALSLPDLDDVTLSGLADGDLLVYDSSSSQWVNQAAAGGSPHALDSHTDVNAPTPSNGDVLTWDSTPGEWVAAAPAAAGVTGSGTVGKLPKFAPLGNNLADSIISEAAGVITVGGDLKVTGDSYVDGAAASVRDFIYSTSGTKRWTLRAEATAEGGSDAGSDFEIIRHDDAGSSLGTALHISRSAGFVTVAEDFFAQKEIQQIIAAGNIYHHFQPGSQDATNPGWQIGAEEASGDFFIRSRFTGNALYEIASDEAIHYFAGKWLLYAEIHRGSLYLYPQDTDLEGGHLTLAGGPNAGGADFAEWNFDNWAGVLRWFTGGVVKLQLSDALFSSTVPVSFGSTLLVSGAASFDGGLVTGSGATRRFTAGATGLMISRFDDNSRPVLLTLANLDGTNTAYGVSIDAQLGTNSGSPIGAGRISFSPKQAWSATASTQDAVYTLGLAVDGSLATMLTMDDTKAQFTRPIMQPSWVTVAADQATFVNAQTNITGMSFAIGANEVWIVDVDVSVTMVGATGVKFYATGPASVTGEIHRWGSTTGPTASTHDYAAVITVPGTFLCTVAGSGWYQMRLTVRTGATAGTIQIVGITQGAAITCAVKKGSTMKAYRTT